MTRLSALDVGETSIEALHGDKMVQMVTTEYFVKSKNGCLGMMYVIRLDTDRNYF